MFNDNLFEQIQAQLRSDGRQPSYYEMGQLPQTHYPQLHERQIEENNAAWAAGRQEQIERHAERVRRHMRRHARRKQPGEATNGRRRQVWCVELGREFASLCAAARFVGRAPSNVLQAIRFRVKCGPFHWERFDPAVHRAAQHDVPSQAVAGQGSRGESAPDVGSTPEQHHGRVGREGGEQREDGDVPLVAGLGGEAP